VFVRTEHNQQLLAVLQQSLELLLHQTGKVSSIISLDISTKDGTCQTFMKDFQSSLLPSAMFNSFQNLCHVAGT